MEGVSIVICCYNSALRLPETLRHIARQQVKANTPWETIVVNNASTDQTKEIAQQLWNSEQCAAPFTIVDELQPGLSHARHCGFETARYEYVLFCDDDNWFSELYVQTVYETMSANPGIGVLGGKGIDVCEVPAPDWFYRYVYPIYAIGDQSEESGEVPAYLGTLYGAGTTFRKSIYYKLISCGFLSKLTDRKGKEISSGGDTELCYAYRICGYKLWYESKQTFKHFIPADRLNWNYVKRFYRGSAKTANILSPYTDILDRRLLSLEATPKYYSLRKAKYLFITYVIPYYKKRIEKLFGEQIEISEAEHLYTYYLRLHIKRLMRYWEYDENLKRVFQLQEQLKENRDKPLTIPIP